MLQHRLLLSRTLFSLSIILSFSRHCWPSNAICLFRSEFSSTVLIIMFCSCSSLSMVLFEVSSDNSEIASDSISLNIFWISWLSVSVCNKHSYVRTLDIPFLTNSNCLSVTSMVRMSLTSIQRDCWDMMDTIINLNLWRNKSFTNLLPAPIINMCSLLPVLIIIAWLRW